MHIQVHTLVAIFSSKYNQRTYFIRLIDKVFRYITSDSVALVPFAFGSSELFAILARLLLKPGVIKRFIILIRKVKVNQKVAENQID